MPVGVLATVPVPLPAFATVTVKDPAGLPHASLEYAENAVLSNARTR
jgi:hypothetical protein